MMAVEVRPASAGPETRRSPAADRRALSADTEPRTLAARKVYPEEPASPKPEPEEDDAPLDLTVRKEISVCEFARHSFADPSDYVRTQMILRQSQDYLASGRDSGTESDDSAGRLSPGDDAMPEGKAYKKSLMKRYSKCAISSLIPIQKYVSLIHCVHIIYGKAQDSSSRFHKINITSNKNKRLK